MRRAAPRSIAHALAPLARHAAPATTLALTQSVWADAVGPAVAAESGPVGEHEGIVIVGCSSSVWAAELHALSPHLLARLNAVLEPAGDGARVTGLRFVVSSQLAARPLLP